MTALTLSLLILAMPLIVPNGSAEEVTLLDPRDTGVEVLLNEPSLSFNVSVLEQLVEEGKASVPEMDPFDIHTEQTFTPSTSNLFLMRSSYDPDFGVALSLEDFTEFLLTQNIDNPMAGISVMIFSPGTSITVTSNITLYSMAINYSENLDNTVSEKAASLGFTDIQERFGPQFSELKLRHDSAEVKLSYSNFNFEEVPNFSINVEIEEGEPSGELRGMVLSLLDLFGGLPTFWEESTRSEFTNLRNKVKVEAGFDPDAVDWGARMRAELVHLRELGIVRYLTDETIDTISGQCERGVMGFMNRLFFHYESATWKQYNSTGFPSPMYEIRGGASIYGEGDLPLRTVPSTDDPEPAVNGLLVALIIVGVSLLFLGSVLYQRINRAVKINNARRKLIYERIHQNPGIHFSALMKDLDLKPGVASYHINRLEKAELIKSYQDGMYRRFYLYEEKVEMRIMLSDLQKIIVNTVNEEPGISQVDISRMVGKSKVVINYHVRFLRDLGLLILEREGRETHCFLTPQGARMSKA
ncbi:MAG: winged helix-turn-helix transcriptional regulator [Thermoplasmatota archaeon]